jgi:hypothetical protein
MRADLSDEDAKILRTHRFFKREIIGSAIQSFCRAWGQRQRLLGKSGARYSRGAWAKTELSEAPVATFFEGDAEAIIAKAEPIIAKDGRRAWIVKD